MDSINQQQPDPAILKHEYPNDDIPKEIEIETPCDSAASTAVTSISSEDSQLRLREIYESTHIETQEQKLERLLIPKLASRAYHLPGNDFGQDWKQYVLNNHPILGICFHHRLHPLKTGQRLLMLLGSFAFGIAVTNAIYFWFIMTGRDSNEEAFALSFSIEGSDGGPSSSTIMTRALMEKGEEDVNIFQGILGCCSLPVLGGRSREIALEKKAEKEQLKKEQKERVKSIMNSPV
eukprot:scaffold17296_cov66-Cyclotella_meneghiniana.AAC.3